MNLEDLKYGEWFRWDATGAKAQYLGEAKTGVFPEGRVYRFRRDNGQRYFVESGKRQVSKTSGYTRGAVIRKRKRIDAELW
jgi:hypothetical protein